MEFTQSQQGLLVISNDSYLVGVLTGYSAANNLSFHSITYTEPLTINKVISICRIILLDLRSSTTDPMSPLIQTLQQINCQYGIPICVVYDQKRLTLSPNFSWVNYLNDVDLIAQLDHYITMLITTSPTLNNDRRSNDRRAFANRREMPSTVSPASNNKFKGLIAHSDGCEERFYVGPFLVDKNSYSVYFKRKNLSLTVKEFKLFMLLAEVHNQVCSTQTIIANLWPDTKRANKSDLYQYMHLLRKKVEVDPEDPRWIQTVKGVGYSLTTKEVYDA